jgi:hypothetical protein
MSKVRIPSVYDVIEATGARRIALFIQSLQTIEVRVDGEKKFEYNQRDRETVFRLALESLGIEVAIFHGGKGLDEAKEAIASKRRFDLWIVTAELCYQTLSIAASLLKVAPSLHVCLEFTEDSGSDSNLRFLLGNAGRLGVERLLGNLVYLKKVPGTPRSIEVPSEYLEAIPATIPPKREPRPRRVKTLTPHTPRAADLDFPERLQTVVSRIVRDTALARKVKATHDFECQICGKSIQLTSGEKYAEAHHIRPLGKPHNGPDVAANILCLCPNHHAELDFGTRKLDAADLRTTETHVLGLEYLKYHNEEVYGRHESSTRQ